MMPIFSADRWLTLHTLVVLVSLVLYAFVSLARRQRRHPSAAIGWVLLLVLVPYLGVPLFLLFGTRKTVRAPRHERLRPDPADPAFQGTAGRFRALAMGLALPPPTPYEDLVIHADGAESLARLHELLLGARRTLQVSTFLLGHDVIGDAVGALLARRAREGVQVRLMIDGVGRYLGGRARLQPLRDAGVDVRLFVRPWSSPLRGRVNLRNHRKLALADGEWLWMGGRNLAAEYFIPPPGLRHRGEAPWTDLTFDVRGPLAADAAALFDHDWAVAANDVVPMPRPPVPPPVEGEAPAGPLAQLLPSGPDQADDTLYELLIDACFNARRRIVALTPYFVPDPALLMAFALAARRGIEVQLVLPRRSNHWLADRARPAALRELLDSGAQVWQTPGMLHAKLVVVDESVALAGSLNLDERSLFLNYEVMAAFYEPADIRRFVAWAEQVRARAVRMLPYRVGALRELGEGLLRWLTFQL